jgi:hypothetical protein
MPCYGRSDAEVGMMNRDVIEQAPARKKRPPARKARQQAAVSDVASDVASPAADLANNVELVADLCRFSEGLLEEKHIRRKWKLDNAVWERMGNDDRFVEKIDDERIRRIRDGSAKRESAQKHVVRAPDVMAGIMNDVRASPKHRIDSAKVLDQFAGSGPQGAQAGERFIIQINLAGEDSSGADVLKFDKAIAITPSANDTLSIANERKNDE